jgi:Flp pilus assembly protein TadB
VSAVLVGCFGAIVGLGLFAFNAALRGGRGFSSLLANHGSVSSSGFVWRWQSLLVPVIALAVYIASGWVVIAFAAGAVAGATPGIGRRPVKHRDEQELVDAIASWTEQLRDTLAGAHGLEQAIIATAQHAPLPIIKAVERLAAFMSYGSLTDGLRRFAEDVDHPTALVTATQHQARDIGVLLGHLAQCARDESRMRSRVWVGRSRTRSAVRIITGVITVFVGGLFIFNRDYLQPYESVEGQLILSMILMTFVAAVVMMHAMSQIEVPERFVRRRVKVVR